MNLRLCLHVEISSLRLFSVAMWGLVNRKNFSVVQRLQRFVRFVYGSPSAQEFQHFFSSVNMEGNQTRFNECSDSDVKKLVATAIPESTKKSTKYAVNVFFTMSTRGLIAKKINGRVIK